MKILASLFTYLKSSKVPCRVAAGLTMVAAIATQPLCATAVQPKLPAKSAIAHKPRVVEIRLSGALADRPHSFNFSLLSLAANRRPALTHLIDRCNALAKNPAVAGVFLNLQGFDLTLTQAQEVAELIHHLRRAGKKVAIYATNFDTNTYLMATAGNEIIMAPHGDMFLPGVQLQLMFFQGVLQKLHLQADMVQIGKYKGAEEPLTRTSASPAFAGEIPTVVNTWFDEIIATIARNRPMLKPADVHADINRGWFDGHAALKAHLVDALADRLTVNHYLRTHFLGFAGRSFDQSLLADLPAGIDPCGENGEFHTFVYDGPVFTRPVPVVVGQVVVRDGRYYADLLPGNETPQATMGACEIPPVH